MDEILRQPRLVVVGQQREKRPHRGCSRIQLELRRSSASKKRPARTKVELQSHSSRTGVRTLSGGDQCCYENADHPVVGLPRPCCSIQARMSSTLQAVIRSEILIGSGNVLALTLRHRVE